MKILERYGISSAQDIINASILFIVGLAFFSYSVFFKHFAEINIQLPFLDFPIFIGEIILFICLGLTVYKWILIKKKFNKFYYIIAGFLLFVLVKAFLGYGCAKLGPLAFRHAALFYYPLFALITYEAYQDKFKNVNALVPLFLIFFLFRPSTYYNFTYLTLMVLYVLKVPNKTFKVLGLAVILAFFPFFMLIDCSRAQLVGNIAAFITLFTLLLLILKIRIRTKLIIAFLCLLFLVLGLVTSKSGRVKSMLTPGSLIAQLQGWDKHIEEIRPDYIRKDIPVRLYNKEHMDDVNMPRAAFLTQNIARKQQNQRKMRCLWGTFFLILGILSVLKIRRNYKAALISLEVLFLVIGFNVLSPKKAELLEFRNSVESMGDNTVFAASEAVKALPVSKRSTIFSIFRSSSKNKSTSKHSSLIEPGKLSEPTMNFTAKTAQKQQPVKPRVKSVEDIIEQEYNTAVFRLLVWRDIKNELLREKKFIGFHFGKPLRSESNEIIKMAYGEWSRDGWLAAHNSYMEALYRSGVVGIALILGMFIIIYNMIVVFVKARSVTGIFLISIIVYWLITALFYVVLDMPYTAISFWSLFGLTLAHSRNLKHLKTQANNR